MCSVCQLYTGQIRSAVQTGAMKSLNTGTQDVYAAVEKMEHNSRAIKVNGLKKG